MEHISVPNQKTIFDMNKLVKEYGDSLLRMCFLYLKDLHMAEDAVQDTFFKVYKSYMNFKGDLEIYVRLVLKWFEFISSFLKENMINYYLDINKICRAVFVILSLWRKINGERFSWK